MRRLTVLADGLAVVASRRGLFARVALAALAVILLWMGGHEARADSFNPSVTVSAANPVADSPTDVRVEVHIPDGDVYYSSSISFSPAASSVRPSSEIHLGVQRSAIDGVAQVGLMNGPCNTRLDLHFDMLNATTDKSRTVTFEDGFKDSNGDGTPDFIDMYPDFNDRILGPAQPFARTVGVGDVAGTKFLEQFLWYEPGATLGGRTFDPALGRPEASFLNNEGDPLAVPAPGAVTDVCSPFDITVTNFGTAPDGTVLHRAPKEPGTYTFNALYVGERDADGDGHENTLDPCPLDSDPTWNPRNVDPDDDPDGDGIPNTCDPTPDQNTGAGDHDGDAYLNRGDNCPLVANGVADADNQKDSDSDGIGDACDPNPNDADAEGEAPEVLLSQDITITAAAAATPSPTAIATAVPATPTPPPAASPTATPAVKTATPTVIAPPPGGAGSTSGTSWPWWPLAVAGGAAAAASGVLLAYRARRTNVK